jgi:hypothetical protein
MLAEVLDRLNSWGALETALHRVPEGVIACGPTSVRGNGCVGAVIWLRARGFYGYRQLQLLGVWAHGTEAVQVTVGVKALTYTAAIYNPEAYHALIRKDYRLYYADDNRPPSAPPLLTYDPARRLAQRQQVERALLAHLA